MEQDTLVVQTKLMPPRLQRRTLLRSRIEASLRDALEHRLTLVQAGAGYGKSTALASLVQSGLPCAWYHLDPDDADAQVFLLYLTHGLRFLAPALAEPALARLEDWSASGAGAGAAVVDLLCNGLAQHLNGPLLLVLDDAHYLNESPQVLVLLDRLIARGPADLHVLAATRYPLELPTLPLWRARGQVLTIDQQRLAFREEEIVALFGQHYGLALSPQQARHLASETEGWAIALQLIWQGMRDGAQGGSLFREPGQPAGLSGNLTRPAEELFAFLAREVLNQQPPRVQRFLVTTAVLRELTVESCDCLRDAGDSEELLHDLLDAGLFVVNLGDGHLRYHHLFREFLLQQLVPEAAQVAHMRAARCFLQQDKSEEAIPHLLAAGALEQAADQLGRLGRAMVRAGRLDTLNGWIGSLPPEILKSHPALLAYLGDIARLHSRFDEALGWYRQAEERARQLGDLRGLGQALRGQARVYLDTVNPSKAEHLLQEALRLADGQEDRESRIRLLGLLAENRLNLGRLADAERFRSQAQELRDEGPSEAELGVRVLIRTGRLGEARRLLEKWAETEQRSPVLRPRAHRETLLLLSLVLTFLGDGEEAYRCAVAGKERGQALESPFITAVGAMRQGHAWLLQRIPQAYGEARRCYHEALALADRLGVPRLKVEAYWGLCRAEGFRGEIEAAREVAVQGIAIARQTGDEWIVAMIRLALGAGLAWHGWLADAHNSLAQAGSAFQECSDAYGETLVRLWQCLAWHRSGDEARLAQGLDDLLRLCREWGYDFLFTRQTLLGPPDPRSLVPLLLVARDGGYRRGHAEGLLAQLGLARLELHPGYQLRIQTLGAFRAWRGEQEIGQPEWQREKARQLLLLLLTHRRRLLEREEITDRLWPDLSPEVAERDFKVALATLYKVLEPQREKRMPSAYVLRDGRHYGIRRGADIWLDAHVFEQQVADGDRWLEVDQDAALACYRRALALYQGNFLEEYPYEEWCSEERERLLVLFLRMAERLAQALLQQGSWEETIQVCQAILAQDDCWEEAYRLMVVAYDRLGNRTQALRTYQRCVERLRAELDVPPSAVTVGLLGELRVG